LSLAKQFTISDVEIVSKRIGLDFVKFTAEQLLEGMNHELEHSDVTSGDPDLTAKIAIKHLEEDPEYYTKLSKLEKKNSKPIVYYCKHIEPGIVAYGEEKLLINNDTLKKMNASFSGLPVYVFHVENVDYSKIKDADGYVIESFYNKLDNWNWAKFIIVSDEGHSAVNKGWSVSNAYVPTAFTKGGDYHAIPYDKEVTEAYYTHLAIVPDPRYEDAKILTEAQYVAYCQKKQEELNQTQAINELKNSNTNGGIKKMNLKFWKKVQVENSADMTDAFVEIDGKEVSVTEMVTAVQNAKKNEDENSKKNADMDTKVKVNGEDMSVKELVDKYNKLTKKNEQEDEEDDEEDSKKNKKNEEENEEETKEEAKKEEEEKKENKAKKNSTNFEELKNAHLKGAESVEVIETGSAQLARGHSRYGSKE
jgi:Protein of unknown function (DUF5661)/Uncharacterized protein conserved in bacteria (DUF2213)